VALVLAFWCVHQPLKVGMAAGFVLGLAMDVADASVMGQHALAYVLLAYGAAGCRAACCGSRSRSRRCTYCRCFSACSW
jgi:rod shape-determining protein MreD